MKVQAWQAVVTSDDKEQPHQPHFYDEEEAKKHAEMHAEILSKSHKGVKHVPAVREIEVEPPVNR